MFPPQYLVLCATLLSCFSPATCPHRKCRPPTSFKCAVFQLPPVIARGHIVWHLIKSSELPTRVICQPCCNGKTSGDVWWPGCRAGPCGCRLPAVATTPFTTAHSVFRRRRRTRTGGIFFNGTSTMLRLLASSASRRQSNSIMQHVTCATTTKTLWNTSCVRAM